MLRYVYVSKRKDGRKRSPAEIRKNSASKGKGLGVVMFLRIECSCAPSGHLIANGCMRQQPRTALVPRLYGVIHACAPLGH